MGGLRYNKKANSHFLQHPMRQREVISGVRRSGLDRYDVFMDILQLLQVGLGVMNISRCHSDGGDDPVVGIGSLVRQVIKSIGFAGPLHVVD